MSQQCAEALVAAPQCFVRLDALRDVACAEHNAANVGMVEEVRRDELEPTPTIADSADAHLEGLVDTGLLECAPECAQRPIEIIGMDDLERTAPATRSPCPMRRSALG
jgi:hypothetical protein